VAFIVSYHTFSAELCVVDRILVHHSVNVGDHN